MIDDILKLESESFEALVSMMDEPAPSPRLAENESGSGGCESEDDEEEYDSLCLEFVTVMEGGENYLGDSAGPEPRLSQDMDVSNG